MDKTILRKRSVKESASEHSKICTRSKAKSKKTKIQCSGSKKKVNVKKSLPHITKRNKKDIINRKENAEIRRCGFKCKYCLHKFSKLADYTIHMNTHLRIKPYTCKFCSREFIHPNRLKLHSCCQKLKTERSKLPCKVCSKIFYKIFTAFIHTRSHDKAKLYPCSLCPQKFLLKSAMFKHQMTHTSNFQCKTCQKVFQMPSQLEQHSFIHMENLAIFKCLYCPRFLRNQIKYEKHINFHIQQAKLKGKRKGLKKEQNGIEVLREKTMKIKNIDRHNFIIDLTEDRFGSIEDNPFDKDVMKNSYDPSVSFLIGPSKLSPKMKEFEEVKGENELTIKNLECVLCNLSFDSVQSFMHHVNSHGSSSENLASKSTAEQDVKVAVARKTIFVCRWCFKKFISLEFAAEHVVSVAESPDSVHSHCMDDMYSDLSADELIDKFMCKFSVGNLKSIAQGSSGIQTFIYHCSKCSTYFKDKKSLFGHINYCNKDEAKYHCPSCNINFQTNRLLREHISFGHKKITDTSLDLIIATTELTKRTDRTEEAIELSCRKCNILFTSSEEFLKHRESKHNGKSLESSVTEETEYLCAHCNRAFSSQADFYRHLNVHQTGTKAATKNDEYRDNMYQDSKTGCWVCKICNKSYSNKSNVTRHITLHDKNEKKEHPCPFCSRIFQYQRYLRHHIMYMHKSKDQKQHICDICKMNFCSVQALKRHFKLHTGESESMKRFKCEYCDRKCKCREELKQHMRVHTGEKPFPCHLCSYQAAVLFNLKKHIERIHENPKQPIRKHKKKIQR